MDDLMIRERRPNNGYNYLRSLPICNAIIGSFFVPQVTMYIVAFICTYSESFVCDFFYK